MAPTRSFELDDDEEDLYFSGKLEYSHSSKFNKAQAREAFRMTSRGPAKRWYLKLRPSSIKKWSELKKTFMSAFMGHTLGEALVMRLNDIRQGYSETMKSYFNRFQNELIIVESISNENAFFYGTA
ncbi:Uncharacterized protein Adt_35007 [Abeliophyllum distichum]|uniref:Retrotransposon gag domain-containing protein n=1 Tax=Abeliophyllum distichum TaxID=126358 RepID=A0ABD1QDR9_9LAMI